MNIFEEPIDRSVIKLGENKTVYIEGYIVDLFAAKHFNKLHKDALKETNSLIRSMAKKYNIESTPDIRKMLIADLAESKTLKAYDKIKTKQ